MGIVIASARYLVDFSYSPVIVSRVFHYNVGVIPESLVVGYVLVLICMAAIISPLVIMEIR